MRTRIPSLVAIALSAAVLTGCGGDSDPSASPANASTTIAANTTAPVPTTAAAPATTTAPATSSAATSAALEARILKAYTDNSTFMSRASIDGLKLTAVGGVVTLNVTPVASAMGPNSKFLGGLPIDALAIASHTSLVASKVTFKDMPEVQRVVVHVWYAFPLTAGGTRTEIATTIAVNRATVLTMDFDALKTTVGRNSRDYLCGADAYGLHVVVWNGLTDKGCLTGQFKGTL